MHIFLGTPLPTASLPTSAHQGPVMLTAKNLQCMRAILSVAHCHGNLLGSSWHIILTVGLKIPAYKYIPSILIPFSRILFVLRPDIATFGMDFGIETNDKWINQFRYLKYRK